MGLHPDIQKLEEKGGFFADQKGDGGPRFRDVPIATPSRDEDADVEMKDSGGDGGRGPSGGDGGATPSGPPIVYHISLTGWMRSAFIAKTSEPTDDDVVMAEVDADDHDGEGKRVAVYMIDDLYARLAKRLSDVFYASEQVGHCVAQSRACGALGERPTQWAGHSLTLCFVTGHDGVVGGRQGTTLSTREKGDQ